MQGPQGTHVAGCNGSQGATNLEADARLKLQILGLGHREVTTFPLIVVRQGGHSHDV